MEKKKSLIHSFGYAIRGILTALKKERNLKIHVVIMLLVILAGIYFKISVTDWIICIILFGFVISLEMVNTAIETTVDIAMPEFNEKAKIAKDVSAGTVLISAITSAIIGLMIFIPKIIMNFLWNLLIKQI